MKQNADTAQQAINSIHVDDKLFHSLIARRAVPLLRLAYYLSSSVDNNIPLTRPLLGDVLSQSTQLEELFDSYGARNNRRWYQLRACTATLKLFSNISYRLLHIHHGLPRYQLLPVEGDFDAATQQTLNFSNDVLRETAKRFLEQAAKLDLPDTGNNLLTDYREDLPAGQLLHNRTPRRVTNTATVVTQLATAFLNLAAESELLHTVAHLTPQNYSKYVPDPVSEESLRYLKHRFHNLQSLYDTYVSDTEIEHLDADLPVLRGHATIIFHLLTIATDLTHYYERHLYIQTANKGLRRHPIVHAKPLLKSLMGYAITFAGRYLGCGQRLCHGMLNHYAKVDRITAPVPRYRGFHVRPSTLIAKIVNHYGSNIRMEFEEDSYNAASPLELFRVNEKINARKRRWLNAEIRNFPLQGKNNSQDRLSSIVLNVVMTLAEQGKLIIYEQPLQLSQEIAGQNDDLLQQVNQEITRLQGTGQIDINTDLTIVFIGDQRVLTDLQILAENGYGEDSFGNNVPLPKALGYLRR
jgi:hypothetical protein